MKIEIDIDEKYADIAVEIKAPKLTQDIEKMISFLRMINMQIAVKKDDEIVLLDTDQILYIEAVERNTFVYTRDDSFEIDLRLYEVEQELLEQGFIRISKTSIINLKKIQSLKADINRKIRVTLINGEQIIVSRMYADELRKRLGVK
ncbi:MAG: LytTR family DNA-binding domain-containing protein [Lachnospiraceae bacterium]